MGRHWLSSPTAIFNACGQSSQEEANKHRYQRKVSLSLDHYMHANRKGYSSLQNHLDRFAGTGLGACLSFPGLARFGGKSSCDGVRLFFDASFAFPSLCLAISIQDLYT